MLALRAVLALWPVDIEAVIKKKHGGSYKRRNRSRLRTTLSRPLLGDDDGKSEIEINKDNELQAIKK